MRLSLSHQFHIYFHFSSKVYISSRVFYSWFVMFSKLQNYINKWKQPSLICITKYKSPCQCNIVLYAPFFGIFYFNLIIMADLFYTFWWFFMLKKNIYQNKENCHMYTLIFLVRTYKKCIMYHTWFPSNYYYILKCQNCAFDYIALTQQSMWHVFMVWKDGKK